MAAIRLPPSAYINLPLLRVLLPYFYLLPFCSCLLSNFYLFSTAMQAVERFSANFHDGVHKSRFQQEFWWVLLSKVLRLSVFLLFSTFLKLFPSSEVPQFSFMKLCPFFEHVFSDPTLDCSSHSRELGSSRLRPVLHHFIENG